MILIVAPFHMQQTMDNFHSYTNSIQLEEEDGEFLLVFRPLVDWGGENQGDEISTNVERSILYSAMSNLYPTIQHKNHIVEKANRILDQTFKTLIIPFGAGVGSAPA